MKKTLLTVLCAMISLFSMAQNEKTYNESYVVSINEGEPSEPQTTDVTVIDNGDGTINFVLHDFSFVIFQQEMQLGDIALEGVTVIEEADGVKTFFKEDTYTIPADKLPDNMPMPASMFENIPYTLGGKMNDERLCAVLEIDMSKMGQMIDVVVGDPTIFFTASKTFTEPLVVSVTTEEGTESSEPQDADVTVTYNSDGTIDFELKNFILTSEDNNIYVGTIYVENITAEEGEDGLTHFSYSGNIFIQEGDLEGVDMWYGPMLCMDEEGNPVGIPVVLSGKMNDDKLFATIDIDMQALQQIVHVQLGTDDFDQPQREGKTYTEPLVVSVTTEEGTDSSEPQDADVVVYDNEDGTIDFELKNFILSAEGGFNLYVGTIYVENIATEVGEDGLTHFAFSGNIFIQEGDLEGVDMWYGPMLCMDEEGNPVGIPVVLSGKMNDDKLFATIDIDMQALQQIVHVQLGTDDFDQPQREGKTYTEPLVVSVTTEEGTDSSEPQDADVVVYDNEDGTIDFELKNFILSAEGGFNLYVGTIYVENIATEVGEDGLTHFAFSGNIFIQEGDLEGVDMWYGPMLCMDEEGNPVGIPVVLSGKMNDDKLFATIDIDMQALQQIVHVQLGTDDFFTIVKGDVDGDGKVDGIDAQAILNVMSDDGYKTECDINKDDKVDGLDYQTVLNIMSD